MEKGIIKKTVLTFYDVIIDGENPIRLTDEQVKDHQIVDGQEVAGVITEMATQDRYDNGEYARSTTIHEYFEIKNSTNEKK